jgi:Na+-driven multidrug efflux pump
MDGVHLGAPFFALLSALTIGCLYAISRIFARNILPADAGKRAEAITDPEAPHDGNLGGP